MTAEIRFKTPADSEMTADQKRVAQAIIDSPRKGIRGPFPALLRRPEMADATRLLGDCVRYKSSLSDKLRELAILLVVRRWNVDLEWASHGKIGREAGISDSILSAVEKGERPSELSADETIIYDVTMELLSGNELSEKTYLSALNKFGEVGVVDIIGAVAYYNYISVIMNGVANPLPEGMTRLPR